MYYYTFFETKTVHPVIRRQQKQEKLFINPHKMPIYIIWALPIFVNMVLTHII